MLTSKLELLHYNIRIYTIDHDFSDLLIECRVHSCAIIIKFSANNCEKMKMYSSLYCYAYLVFNQCCELIWKLIQYLNGTYV